MPFAAPVIIGTACAGFVLARYIRHKKQRGEQITCPLDADCGVVVHSEYAQFFGIPVELLGMWYYGGIAVFYAFVLLFPAAETPSALFAAFAFTTAAFLFSLYLTFIQAFALGEWCSWCLLSAGLSTLIFVASIVGVSIGFLPLLAEYTQVIGAAHFFAIALGVGGATLSTLFFFKFLKDFRISSGEADVLRTLSQVIWFALAVLVVSGLGLYLPTLAARFSTPELLLKAVIIAVLVISGAILHLAVFPRLVQISFGERHSHEAGELVRARRLSFALSAVTILSWYGVFVLEIFGDFAVGFGVLVAGYAAALFLVVAASQIISRMVVRQGSENTHHS